MTTKTTGAKHTPGPWNATETGRIYGEGGARYIAQVDAMQETESQRSADARLIAAAPELLEAAREITEVLEKANALGDEYEWDPIEEAKRLRAALSKAGA